MVDASIGKKIARSISTNKLVVVLACDPRYVGVIGRKIAFLGLPRVFERLSKEAIKRLQASSMLGKCFTLTYNALS
jgi:hypothetical protein